MSEAYLRAYKLPGGEIAYPVTVKEEGRWMGDGFDIALPGSPEHAKWSREAIPAPEGMFTLVGEGGDDDEPDEEVDDEP